MKILVFFGLTIVFAQNFFEYADGQLPLPMAFPGAFPLPGLAPMAKLFPVRRPTVLKRHFHAAERASPEPEAAAERASQEPEAAAEANSTVTQNIPTDETTFLTPSSKEISSFSWSDWSPPDDVNDIEGINT